MVNRDSRYDLIKPMIATGKIVVFNDIFKYIPKTIVATDLGKKVDRFTILMNKVEGFTYAETFMIGKFCELSEAEMNKLVMADYMKNKNKITKPIKSL
ncbi:MAG TPA: hypothetical protein VE035_07115 [Puia sp.]|nr:hypothetical protein [Puia sp.]